MIKKIFLSEKFIFSAILLNALVIFLLAFPQLAQNSFLVTLDCIFIGLFLLEVLVKMIVLGPRQFFKNGWNIFDFVIVLLSMPAFGAIYTHSPNSIFLLFRLLRLIRLVKFIHFVPHMRQLAVGLVRAFKASIFVLIALGGLNFVLAVITCHFYGDTSPEYFGNPLIAAYTIFQLFTLEGWNEVVSQIITDQNGGEVISGLSRIYFISIILIGGIFGISLANAVFVDEMTIDNNIELEKKMDRLQIQIEEIKELLQQRNE